MKSHACLILLILCTIGQAKANGRDTSRHPGLQVGGPLRIVKTDDEGIMDSVISQREILSSIEPLYGETSSLSLVLNADGQLLVDLEAGTDADMSYDLSESVSIAVGYHFVEAEDREEDLVISGGMDADHESHRLLLRANWRFQ